MYLFQDFKLSRFSEMRVYFKISRFQDFKISGMFQQIWVNISRISSYSRFQFFSHLEFKFNLNLDALIKNLRCVRFSPRAGSDLARRPGNAQGLAGAGGAAGSRASRRGPGGRGRVPQPARGSAPVPRRFFRRKSQRAAVLPGHSSPSGATRPTLRY